MFSLFRKRKIVLNSSNRRFITAELFNNFKVLEVTKDYLIGAKGYKLYKYNLSDRRWEYYSRIVDSKYSFFSQSSLLSRLLRAEITNLYTFINNEIFCIAKKGIFKFSKEDGVFKKCYPINRGSRPLNLCQDNDGTIYFGEYFSNKKREAVNVFRSNDNGNTWQIAYTFKKGIINHVHGIFKDLYSNKLWIVTGDRGDECLIGYTEDSFKTLKIIFRGGQEFRTCGLMFYPDFIVFATDSQYIKNKIKLIDRKSYKVTELKRIQGSCIYSTQCGNFSMLSTTIEPSKVNLDNNSYLWVTLNGKEWSQVASIKKSFLSSTLFQFGTIRFPKYSLEQDDLVNIYFTGRSLKKINRSTVAIKIENIKK